MTSEFKKWWQEHGQGVFSSFQTRDVADIFKAGFNKGYKAGYDVAYANQQKELDRYIALMKEIYEHSRKGYSKHLGAINVLIIKFNE